MQKIVSSQVSAATGTEVQVGVPPVETGPVELDFSVLSQVGGAGPHGSWVTVVVPCAVSGPHGSW